MLPVESVAPSPSSFLLSLDPYNFLHPLRQPQSCSEPRNIDGNIIYLLGESCSLKTSLLFQLAANAGLSDLLVSFITSESLINQSPPLFPTDTGSQLAFPETALDRVQIQLLRGGADVRSYVSTLSRLPPTQIPSALLIDAADVTLASPATSGAAYAPLHGRPAAPAGCPAGHRSGLPARVATTADLACAIAAVRGACDFVTASVLPQRAPRGSVCRAVVVGALDFVGAAQPWSALGGALGAVYGRRAVEASSTGGPLAVAAAVGGASATSAAAVLSSAAAAADRGGGEWGAHISAGPLARTSRLADSVVMTWRAPPGVGAGGGPRAKRARPVAQDGLGEAADTPQAGARHAPVFVAWGRRTGGVRLHAPAGLPCVDASLAPIGAVGGILATYDGAVAAVCP